MKSAPKKPRGRVLPCVRCGETKRIRARGACDACYVKFQRSGITERLGPVRTEHLWSAASLRHLKLLRGNGLTVRQCCEHFPNRSYWSVRLCCVSRKFVRVSIYSKMANATARTLRDARRNLPDWWEAEAMKESKRKSSS